jgi:hypothetical protein
MFRGGSKQKVEGPAEKLAEEVFKRRESENNLSRYQQEQAAKWANMERLRKLRMAANTAVTNS